MLAFQFEAFVRGLVCGTTQMALTSKIVKAHTKLIYVEYQRLRLMIKYNEARREEMANGKCSFYGLKLRLLFGKKVATAIESSNNNG